VDWIGIEIHPETPAGGRPLTELFPAADIKRMTNHLRTMAAPFGITFADFANLPNSRNAHLAAEYARAQGKFPELHASLFSAYFSEGLDISDLEILAELAKDAGLDSAELVRSIQQGTFSEKLSQAQKKAKDHDVSGVPAFFIGDKERIMGAQPIEVFRKVLKTIESNRS